MAWEYEDRELCVLCEDCHGEEHQFKERIEQVLMDFDQLYAVPPLLAGFLFVQMRVMHPDLQDRDRELFASGAIAAHIYNHCPTADQLIEIKTMIDDYFDGALK